MGRNQRIHPARADTQRNHSIGAADYRRVARAHRDSANPFPPPPRHADRRHAPLGGGEPQPHPDCLLNRPHQRVGRANPNPRALDVCHCRGHRAGHQRADYVPFRQPFAQPHQAIFRGRLHRNRRPARARGRYQPFQHADDADRPQYFGGPAQRQNRVVSQQPAAGPIGATRQYIGTLCNPHFRHSRAAGRGSRCRAAAAASPARTALRPLCGRNRTASGADSNPKALHHPRRTPAPDLRAPRRQSV